MKNFVAKLAQVTFDVLIGLAVYYCTSIAGVSSMGSILLTILFTALFAEFVEVNSK